MSTRVHREIAERTGDDLVSRLRPDDARTRPPASCASSRAREIVPLDMSLEDATKLIISAGLVTEPDALRRPAASRSPPAPLAPPRPSR